MDDDLDEHEDGSTEARRNCWSHSETGEDSAETLAVVPSPLNVACTGYSYTDTGNSGDKRVSRGDVGTVRGMISVR